MAHKALKAHTSTQRNFPVFQTERDRDCGGGAECFFQTRAGSGSNSSDGGYLNLLDTKEPRVVTSWTMRTEAISIK